MPEGRGRAAPRWHQSGAGAASAVAARPLPLLPSGSVTKMTLKDNHLIVVTEERHVSSSVIAGSVSWSLILLLLSLSLCLALSLCLSACLPVSLARSVVSFALVGSG
ncbi:uncharacterized protein Dana_GF27182 [Drosophila ananassae]|uniref:Uncharacterized protein n=1 Tax=Drosophila ananassae TaxID=7217 RepID=A0A0P8XJY0_DROAN|nr:uncharacterized protein Dana_GF27182 [Drosophila ananassae]